MPLEQPETSHQFPACECHEPDARAMTWCYADGGMHTFPSRTTPVPAALTTA
ncbi:hypothetical protein ACH4KO_33270 [Streptomyces anulatus]